MLYMYHFGVWIQETASTSGNANAYLKDNVPLDVHASVRFWTRSSAVVGRDLEEGQIVLKKKKSIIDQDRKGIYSLVNVSQPEYTIWTWWGANTNSIKNPCAVFCCVTMILSPKFDIHSHCLPSVYDVLAFLEVCILYFSAITLAGSHL